jgi:hypothetical protein
MFLCPRRRWRFKSGARLPHSRRAGEAGFDPELAFWSIPLRADGARKRPKALREPCASSGHLQRISGRAVCLRVNLTRFS